MLFLLGVLGVVASALGQVPNRPMQPPINPNIPPVNVPGPGRPFIPPALPRPLTIADKIVMDPEVSQMVSFLQRVDLLKSLNATSFVSTMFLPTNEAIAAAELPMNDLDLLKLVEYHYVANNITTDKMLSNGHRWTLNETYFNGSSVWFYVQQRPTGETHYYVNGALIQRRDNLAANGVYHVIDRVLKPIGSLKSAGDYMQTEQDFQNMTYILTDSRAMSLSKELSNESIVWTIFAPVDHMISDGIIQEQDPVQVLSRHIVKGRVLFDSSLMELTNVRAVQGEIIITKEAERVFVKNGRGERAEIVSFNQPTENGVIHRISDFLGFYWRTICQTLDMHSSLTELRRHVKKSNLDISLSDRNRNYTLFAPSNQAFSRYTRHRNLTETQLQRVIECHIAEQPISSLDVPLSGLKLTMMSTGDVTVTRKSHSVNPHMEVTHNGQQIRISHPDITTANGIVHIVDRVFEGCESGSPSQTLKMISFPALILALLVGYTAV